MKQLLLLSLLLLAACSEPTFEYSPLSKNYNCEKLKPLVLMIGDGMGPEQVKAASLYHSGKEDSFVVFNKSEFPQTSMVSTKSASDPITDSAAGATAMATGHKVSNGELSIDSKERPLRTILEGYKKCGYLTGLVSTSYLLDATPAAFGSHVKSRKNKSAILEQYLNSSRPNLLLGGGRAISDDVVEKTDYHLVKNVEQLQGLKKPYPKHIMGSFTDDRMTFELDKSTTEPTLKEMTSFALDYMLAQKRPFFLMIEGGRIDHSGHANFLNHNIAETIMFMNTVAYTSKRVKELVHHTLIVTADHETGGLKLKKSMGEGVLPKATFSTQHHTGVDVQLWMRTTEKHSLPQKIENTAVIPF